MIKNKFVISLVQATIFRLKMVVFLRDKKLLILTFYLILLKIIALINLRIQNHSHECLQVILFNHFKFEFCRDLIDPPCGKLYLTLKFDNANLYLIIVLYLGWIEIIQISFAKDILINRFFITKCWCLFGYNVFIAHTK